MKKRFLLYILTCGLILNACDDNNDNDTSTENNNTCDNTFTPRCSYDEKGNPVREYCQDNTIVKESCPDGSVCRDGECGCGSSNCCFKNQAGTSKYVCEGYSTRYDMSVEYTCTRNLYASSESYFWDYSSDNEQTICHHGCDTNTGKCIKDAEFEGEHCNYDMKEYCRDGYLVSCEDNQLVANKCDEGTVCMDIAENDAAYCEFPCLESELGKVSQVCIPVTNGDTGEIVYYYSRTQKCERATDKSGNTLYYQSYQNEVECKHSCDENGCTKIHPDEGKKCDEVTDDGERCEGNIFVACAIHCINGKCSDSMEATDCGKQICLEEVIDGVTNAGCYDYDPCESSQLNTEKRVKCDEEYEPDLIRVLKCEKYHDKYLWRDISGCIDPCEATQKDKIIGIECDRNYSTYKQCTEIDGLYQWEIKTDYCEDSCDPKTKLCHQPSSADECNAATFIQVCDGTKLKGCIAGKVGIIEDCAAKTTFYWGEQVEGNFKNTCVAYEDGAKCEPACTKAEAAKYKLSCNEYAKQVVGDICAESPNHTLYWDTYDEYCEHGCNDTKDGCFKYHPDEGKKCDETFVEKCIDNMPLVCSYGVISANPCEDETLCAVFDNHAQCANTCTAEEVAPLEFTCHGGHSEGGECVKQGDKYVWHVIREGCTHGCNEDGTCIHLYETEGDYCAYSKLSCKDSLLTECSYYDNKIHITDCSEEGMTCISNEYNAKCVNLCTEEEFNTNATKKACVKGAYKDYSYQLKCVNSYISDDKYEWSEDTSIPHAECENGCNNDTGECNES